MGNKQVLMSSDDVIQILRNKIFSLHPIYDITMNYDLDDRSKFLGSDSLKIVPENEDEFKDFILFKIASTLESLNYNFAGINIYIDIDTKVKGKNYYPVDQIYCKGITLKRQDSDNISEFNKEQLDNLVDEISRYVEDCYISFFSKFYNKEATTDA